MADERDARKRLHPDDLAELFGHIRDDVAAIMRESQKSVPPYPPSAPKPPLFEGRDDADAIARMLRRSEEDILRKNEEAIRKACEGFLTKAQIEEAIYNSFEDIGLPVDTKENRRATGDRIRRMLRWEKSANVVLTGIVGSGLVSAAYAILKLIGFNPTPPPGSH